MSTSLPRILVADDDEAFAGLIVEMLRQAGYQCDTVLSGKDTLDAMARTDYDLLIADLAMPGNERLQLLHSLQERKSTVPVIIMTGHASVETAVEALHLSVVDYLEKPPDFKTLRLRIGAALEQGRALRVLAKARAETGEWMGAMSDLHQMLAPLRPTIPGAGLSWVVEQYVDQMTAHLMKLALSFRSTVALARGATPPATTDVCALLTCPRRTAYKEAVEDTIATLEKTKTAFKSKDLADLRKRLEHLLQEDE